MKMQQLTNFRNIPRENQIGFIGSLVSYVCIAICTLILPNFDWAVNPLSDLGSWYRTDLGNLQILSAILFNGGLIVAGLLNAYFTIWLIRKSTDLPTKIGLVFFVGTSILLTGIGVFSEDFGAIHSITAISFFLSIPIACAIIGLVWVRLKETRSIGGLSILLALLALLIIFQPWVELSIAVLETLAGLVSAVWIWFVDYMDLKNKFSSIQKTN
jgi:hypothetical membrane protein